MPQWLRSKAVLATLLVVVLAVVAGAVVLWRLPQTVTDASTGVEVQALRGAEISIVEVAEPPALPAEHRLLGKVSKVEVVGGLDQGDSARISLPYPADLSPEQAEQLWVMRYDGARWRPLAPSEVDHENRRLSVRTREFSLWGISQWDVEQSVAESLNTLNTPTSLGLTLGVAGA